MLLIGFLLALLIAFGAYRLHALSTSGAIATAILGTIVFGLGGIPCSVPLLTFFILSSLLSRVGTRGGRSKERFETVFEKGSRRDAGQVLANGGIAGAIVLLMILLILLRVEAGLYIAYLGTLAAAAADTWGTEIGVLGRGRVISLATLRPVPAGVSGGVSLIGTLGAAGGALSVALSGIPWSPRPLRTVMVVLAAGIIGMAADSLVGATLQARYRCTICGASTERRAHCDHPTELSGGYRWITNDVVNVICSLMGAIAAYLLGMVAVG